MGKRGHGEFGVTHQSQCGSRICLVALFQKASKNATVKPYITNGRISSIRPSQKVWVVKGIPCRRTTAERAMRLTTRSRRSGQGGRLSRQ